ncbi:MAG: protein phosphatase 2C domain-containing protein [Tannerella sp.]|jgi:serine/threonine protein phosphatase PrpC|nr:protein phosphatase 2C domain-containing protein [Tannerella sp.]
MITGTALPDDEAREKARDGAFAEQIKGSYISFPNGKVNHPYSVPFDAESLLPEAGEIRLEGLEAAGLRYNAETKQIEGIPAQAGDYKITLQCKRKNAPEGRPPIQRELTLIINPDPRSLWNHIPTSTEIEYYKPDEDRAFVKVKSKITTHFFGLSKTEEKRRDMVAASQRGRSHAHEGRPRDDDFALHFDEQTGWYTMVVADGAGSARYSRRGSQIACRTVVEVCRTLIPAQRDTFEKAIAVFDADKSQENRNEVGKILYGIIGNAAFKAYKSIEEEAAAKGSPMKDYATTLLLAVCRKFDFGWFVGAFWVGDGGIGVYRTEPPLLKIMGEPDGGEFAGQTRFLTMPEIMQATEIYRRLRFDTYPDFTALILMTDGVTDPKFETDANLHRIEKWHDLWNDLNGQNEDHARVDFTDDNEEAAGQLLKWLDFWSKGNHDDRTVAILF